MFSELTLALHVILIILMYVFLYSVVRTVGRDVLHSSTTNTYGYHIDPRLHALFNDGSELEYRIDFQLVIGRADDCDIILEDTFVSSHHARVYSDDSAIWLEDLGSTNGTFFNHKRLTAPVRLTPDDTFKIGNSLFKYLE